LKSASATATVAVALVLLAGAQSARAEAVEAPGKGSEPPVAGTEAESARGPALGGFDALASAGWGMSTSTIGELELAPYGATFGIDVGYTWPVGFRLGAQFDNSLGHSVVTRRDPRIGRDYDVTADTSSISGGISLGWDLPFYAVVLRYNLRFGVTAMRWNFADARTSAEFATRTSPSVAVNFAPGVAVLYPYRRFEAGVGFDYLAQNDDGVIPSGLIVKLLIGVRP
jgi:hypothetical protein